MLQHNKHPSNPTKRELFEIKVMERFQQIRPFDPKNDARLLHEQAFGTFGLSATAFALYAGGYNSRGESRIAPCGLICNHPDVIFGLGYYRKEGEPLDSDGYAMIIAPQENAVFPDFISQIEEFNSRLWNRGAKDFINAFAHIILKERTIPCKGVYFRHLQPSHWGAERLLDVFPADFDGLSGGKWHPDAAFEDETYPSSTIFLSELFDEADPVSNRINKITKKKKNTLNRFNHFLERNKLAFELRPVQCGEGEISEEIIKEHFNILRETGKAIGSAAEDYFAITRHILRESVEGVYQYFGCINGIPLAIFVGENIGRLINNVYLFDINDAKKHPWIRKTKNNWDVKHVGLYLSIAMRSIPLAFDRLGLNPNEQIQNLGELIKKGEASNVLRSQGFSAFSLFCIIEFARMLFYEHKIHSLSLGGSETNELQIAKESIGAIPQKVVPWLFRSW